jgi:diguanylate cyclase (GGDEF)-like protein/PAS domain S-box-containing protein
MPGLSAESDDAAEQRYRVAFEHAVLPAWFCDAELRLTEVNDALCSMLGRSREELLGRRLSDFVRAEERTGREQQDDVTSLLAGERSASAREQQLLRPDGTPVWALVALSVVRDRDGAARFLIGQATDLTEHRVREKRLRHLADHDPLTGLVNRRGFGRELRRHASRIVRYGAKGALLMLDLDSFKAYNDANGHAGGDALLQAIASGLDARLCGGDLVGRIGGDEFAVLLPEATPQQAEVVAAALVQAVHEIGEASNPHVTASVGIFCFNEQDGLSEHHAMVGADLAMYAAKHAGRNRYAPFALWTSASPSRSI